MSRTTYYNACPYSIAFVVQNSSIARLQHNFKNMYWFDSGRARFNIISITVLVENSNPKCHNLLCVGFIYIWHHFYSTVISVRRRVKWKIGKGIIIRYNSFAHWRECELSHVRHCVRKRINNNLIIELFIHPVELVHTGPGVHCAKNSFQCTVVAIRFSPWSMTVLLVPCSQTRNIVVSFTTTATRRTWSPTSGHMQLFEAAISLRLVACVRVICSCSRWWLNIQNGLPVWQGKNHLDGDRDAIYLQGNLINAIQSAAIFSNIANNFKFVPTQSLMRVQ